jgi:site-specific recombinase XerD
VKRLAPGLDEIFERHIQILATTLRPHTVANYRYCARKFLAYLHAAFPQLQKLAQLRRAPHLIGWLCFLCQQNPPIRNYTRSQLLIQLRRMLRDLADNGHHLSPDLIRPEDFPPQDHFLPKPLSPEDDERLQQQLRETDSLLSNALRLIRATGIRAQECIDLRLDCLQQLGKLEAALHVPLGKLHSERWIPVDEETQRIVARIMELRALAPAAWLARSHGLLLPRRGGRHPVYDMLCRTLAQAAQRAGCTGRVTLHRLRHTYATEMVRLGVSLPALMQMLGHKDVNMTLRYVEVIQLDLQREFHQARQNTASPHPIPQLPLPSPDAPVHADLSTICHAIATVRHLLQLFHAQLQDASARRRLRRLTQRILNVGRELDHLTAK